MTLFKYRTLNMFDFKFVFDIFKNKRLWASSRQELNDPWEGLTDAGVTFREDGFQQGLNHFTGVVDLTNEVTRICSITQEDSLKPTNLLAWSHYSQGHSGICFELSLDFDRLENTENGVISVPQINHSHEGIIKELEDALKFSYDLSHKYQNFGIVKSQIENVKYSLRNLESNSVVSERNNTNRLAIDLLDSFLGLSYAVHSSNDGFLVSELLCGNIDIKNLFIEREVAYTSHDKTELNFTVQKELEFFLEPFYKDEITSTGIINGIQGDDDKKNNIFTEAFEYTLEKLSGKHQIWNYEDEVRIITLDSFVPVNIEKVYCGMKISKEDYGIIRDLCELYGVTEVEKLEVNDFF